MTTLEQLGRRAAATICAGYERYREEFREITGRASERFEAQDWQGGQRDAAERLALYRGVVGEVVTELEEVLGGQVRDTAVWRTMKPLHEDAIAEFADEEISTTFYNSITRRVFATVGVDPRIEYVDLDLRRHRYGPGAAIHRTYPCENTRDLVVEILVHPHFSLPFQDLVGDALLVAERIDEAWRNAGRKGPVERVEMIDAVFYRGSGAYLVGRMRGGGTIAPLALVVVHGESGLKVDAVLLTEAEVSIVFSFTRSHFHVEMTRPSEVIRFLRSIMPRKPLAEMYICLGYAKHGKTELYQDLLSHLERSMDRFVRAPGDVGMVMIVFTLRHYDYVFKVIRDHFAYPKTNTRDDVIQRYQLVFEHDRAGRLIEAQEYEHLTFDRHRFDPDVLEELTTAAADTVTIEGDRVAIHHLYVERKVHPLNLFLRAADDEVAAEAVLDYGLAIRDLATTNIFPGDLLLKNFGVTRQGRVIFYDYDELCLVTECEFRDLPTARDANEEMAAEPWYYVGEHDVFPEEFVQFLGLPGPLRRLFVEVHGDVLTAEFWRTLQRRHRAGEVLDVFPYAPSKRLCGR